MEKSIKQKSDLEEELTSGSNQLDFSAIFRILIQRKKLFILISTTFFFIATADLVYKRIRKPIYEGSFTLMISDPFLNDRGQNDSIENLALNKESLDIPTLVQYLKSPNVVSKVAEDNNISPISLINRINISVPRNSGGLSSYLSKTLLISLEGENKLKMIKILRDLSKQYVVSASDSRNQRLSDGIKFLNNQKPNLLERVKEVQKELEQFRLKNRIIDPIKEGDKITNLIEENRNKILSLNSENVRLLFIKENLVNGIIYTEGINNSRTSSNSTGIQIIGSDQLLLQEILDLKSKLANAQSKYKKSSIVVKNLNDKLSQLKPIVLKNQESAVDAAIIVNNSLIKSYENQLTELKKKFISIPRKVSKYSTIMQNLKILENNLQSLNETKDKLQLELSQGTLSWKIIKEPYVNPSAIKPEMQKSLIYIIMISISIGGLIVVLVDKYDNVFHNPKEVESFINLPVLGFVPFLRRSEEEESRDGVEVKQLKISDFYDEGVLNIANNIKFIFEETFRNIYTSIKFSKSDKEIKIVNITSTIPEEGKSLCSIFLALNIAQLSKRVLIIDSDMRKPSLHKRLEIDNISGLSNYLVNNDSDWRKYIKTHKSLKNLSYITAGKIPPSALTLLESNKMKTFVEELRNNSEFDFIIIDCPPLLGLSDAVIVSNYVDATILTVSLNKVNKSLSVESLKKLSLSEKPIIGTIINSVSKDTSNQFIGNKYGNYGNPYSYYSYQYMPLETQNRYLNEEDKIDSTNNNYLDLFKNKKFLEKIKTISNKFRKWLNE